MLQLEHFQTPLIAAPKSASKHRLMQTSATHIHCHEAISILDAEIQKPRLPDFQTLNLKTQWNLRLQWVFGGSSSRVFCLGIPKP